MAGKAFAGITDQRLRDAVRDAVKRGWTARQTGKNHIVLRHPNGTVVVCAGTPGSRRSAIDVERRIRRAEEAA